MNYTEEQKRKLLDPNTTPAERIKIHQGEPKEKAHKIQGGFLRTVWAYRGFEMHHRKNAGWASGSEWFTNNHPTQNHRASSKLELMLKIDRWLAAQKIV